MRERLNILIHISNYFQTLENLEKNALQRAGVTIMIFFTKAIMCDTESHRKAPARTSNILTSEEVLERPWDHGLHFGAELSREQQHTCIRPQVKLLVLVDRSTSFIIPGIRFQPGPADDPLP